MRRPHQRLAKLAAAITGDPVGDGTTVPEGMKSAELAARITALEGNTNTASPAAPLSYPFTNAASLTITHNLGRLVTAKAYLASGQEIAGATGCPDLNTATIYFSTSQSGTVVLA